MIWEALSFVTNELNASLRRKYNTNEEIVILSNLVNPDGTSIAFDDNRIVVTLVKIDPEQIPPASHQSFANTNPVQNVNLHILFSAITRSGNYQEGLKLISGVISFFQSERVFSSGTHTGLSRLIDKANFEMVRLELMEQTNIWSALGAKYMPSVVYKMRTLTYSDTNYSGEVPRISGMNASGEISKP